MRRPPIDEMARSFMAFAEDMSEESKKVELIVTMINQLSEKELASLIVYLERRDD